MPISSSVEGFQWNGLIRLIRVAFAVNPLSNFQIANFPGSDIRRNLELVSNLNFQWYYSALPPLITKPSIYVITTFFVQCKQSLSFVKIIQSTLWQKRILTYILVIDRSYQEYHILTPKFSFWRSLLFFVISECSAVEVSPTRTFQFSGQRIPLRAELLKNIFNSA